MAPQCYIISQSLNETLCGFTKLQGFSKTELKETLILDF